MLIGFNAPVAGPLAEPEALTQIAVEGEAMGFDYLACSDHIVIPTDIQARYPYSETGEFPQGARGGRHEQLTEIAFLAAKTSRLRLVTSVMVVPHRPAVLTAKILSTIDVLSKGRLTVGIGAGWLREEFEAIGAPPFAARGAVTDEYLQAFRELWTKDQPASPDSTRGSAASSSRPSPCRRRIPRSGWVAKAGRRSAARPDSATVGIRSASTPPIRSTACRATRRQSRDCAGWSPRPGATPRR